MIDEIDQAIAVPVLAEEILLINAKLYKEINNLRNEGGESYLRKCDVLWGNVYFFLESHSGFENYKEGIYQYFAKLLVGYKLKYQASDECSFARKTVVDLPECEDLTQPIEIKYVEVKPSIVKPNASRWSNFFRSSTVKPERNIMLEEIIIDEKTPLLLK